jgi:hypothetical protein
MANSKAADVKTDRGADDGLERMNKALRAALQTPPRKHADEPKRADQAKKARKK